MAPLLIFACFCFFVMVKNLSWRKIENFYVVSAIHVSCQLGWLLYVFFVEWIIIDLFYSLQVSHYKKLNYCSKWLSCNFYGKMELSYLMLLLFSKPQKRRGISASLLFLSYKIKTPLVSISALEWVSLLVHSYKEVIDIALLKTKLCAKYQLWNYERLISEQDAAY